MGAGNPGSLQTINQFLCSRSGASCAADKSGSDRLRASVMNPNFFHVGLGFAFNSTYGEKNKSIKKKKIFFCRATFKNYWTVDLSGSPIGPGCPVFTSRIYSGFFFFFQLSISNFF